MSTVSLCMIVRNEEAVLGRCLDSVRELVDEIVIVDTGSTDATRAIAHAYTDRVFDFPWIDDFSAARNFSFDRAQMDYCMWLDADDILLPDDQARFRQMRESALPGADVVMMPYHVAFDASGMPTMTYYRERVVRRGASWRWQGAVHEAITPSGRVVWCDAAVTHRKEGPGEPGRNLRIFEALLARGRELQPREQFYYGRELFYHARYGDAIRRLTAFLDGGQGWIENDLEACRTLSACFSRLGRQEEALQALLRALTYPVLPRAELCCDLGEHWLGRGEYEYAAYWYERALECRPQERSGAFFSPDAYGYLPCIRLCLCLYRLGQPQRAREWNARAGLYKPGDSAYLYNKRFFDSLS